MADRVHQTAASVRYVPLSRTALEDIASSDSGISTDQREAMALPTYQHWNPLIRWLFHRRYAIVASLLDVPPGGHVLEFGCGVGAFLPSLVAARLEVSALDIVLDYARALDTHMHLGVRFVERIEQIADGSLDGIVAADVLEHVDDLGGCIATFRRKLVDGGCLVVSSPTENFAYRVGRMLAGFSGEAEYHHDDAATVEATIAAGRFTREARRTLPLAIPPHLFSIVRFRAS